MKIAFLGTGASEGIPSMHCKCAVCENARKVGGKEIRSRMSVLIDDKLMIDCPPDAYMHAIKYKIDYGKVKDMLITHSHSDHCYVDNIIPRVFRLDGQEFETFHVYGNNTVVEMINAATNEEDFIKAHELYYSSSTAIKDYRVTPFRAAHILGEKCMLYLVEKDGKRYLHLADTGVLDEEIFDWLRDRKAVIDAVAIDTTYGLIETEYGGHLNFKQSIKTCEKFRQKGIFTADTQIYMTHICHCGGTHELLSKRAEAYGMHVAYDGLIVEV